MDDTTTIREMLAETTKKLGQPVLKIRWSADEARDYDPTDPRLDVVFDAGYGGTNCVPFYAWTKSWVIFVHAYDGAEWLECVPRSPAVRTEVEHKGD